jgi:hypothetical protein
MKTTTLRRNARKVTVRSMRADANGMRAEWTEDAKSFRAAWGIVDSCGATKDDCKVYHVVDGIWHIDISG